MRAWRRTKWTTKWTTERTMPGRASMGHTSIGRATIGRALRRAVLVPAALALAACATEGGLGPRTADIRDGRQISASMPPEPISGSRSLPPAELAALPSEAEEAYRARRFDEAIALYERLLVLQPSNAHGWLRLGNVHHQRRHWFKALGAYRRAAARTIDGVEIEAGVRAKAIYNVVLIDLELARQGLRTLERLGPAAAAAIGDAAPLAHEVERTQHALDAFASSSRPAQAEDSSSGASAGERPGNVHVPRRARVRGADGPRRVDYIRGEPRP